MRKIAVIHDPSSSHAYIWKTWLESANFYVDTIYDENSFNYSKSIQYDLIVPLITISDYTNKDNARMKAMSYFESIDIKLLTPSDAIAASSDKLRTANMLRSSSLPHPRTGLAEEFVWDSEQQMPVVLKPRFGHSGNGIFLAQNEDEFNKFKRRDMLVQNFVQDAECVRIIASQSETLSAYKKVPPEGEFIANIDRGANRLSLVPTELMEQLALSSVKALGGGLMGVDLLDSPEGLFILEANVPFGFDASDRDLQQKLITYIHKEVQ